MSLLKDTYILLTFWGGGITEEEVHFCGQGIVEILELVSPIILLAALVRVHEEGDKVFGNIIIILVFFPGILFVYIDDNAMMRRRG